VQTRFGSHVTRTNFGNLVLHASVQSFPLLSQFFTHPGFLTLPSFIMQEHVAFPLAVSDDISVAVMSAAVRIRVAFPALFCENMKNAPTAATNRTIISTAPS